MRKIPAADWLKRGQNEEKSTVSMLMMEWGKEQSITRENTTEYNTIENKKKWKSKFTGDGSESSGKKNYISKLYQ